MVARVRRRRQPKAVDDEVIDCSTTTSTTTATSSGHSEMTDDVTNSVESSVVAGAPSNVHRLISKSRISRVSNKIPAAGGNSQAPWMTPSPDGMVHRSSANPLPGLGPERPQPSGPTGRCVFIPPKTHCEPRGWAPASHNIPAVVKRTWGRAKAKFIAPQQNQFAN